MTKLGKRAIAMQGEYRQFRTFYVRNCRCPLGTGALNIRAANPGRTAGHMGS